MYQRFVPPTDSAPLMPTEKMETLITRPGTESSVFDVVYRSFSFRCELANGIACFPWTLRQREEAAKTEQRPEIGPASAAYLRSIQGFCKKPYLIFGDWTKQGNRVDLYKNYIAVNTDHEENLFKYTPAPEHELTFRAYVIRGTGSGGRLPKIAAYVQVHFTPELAVSSGNPVVCAFLPACEVSWAFKDEEVRTSSGGHQKFTCPYPRERKYGFFKDVVREVICTLNTRFTRFSRRYEVKALSVSTFLSDVFEPGTMVESHPILGFAEELVRSTIYARPSYKASVPKSGTGPLTTGCTSPSGGSTADLEGGKFKRGAMWVTIDRRKARSLASIMDTDGPQGMDAIGPIERIHLEAISCELKRLPVDHPEYSHPKAPSDYRKRCDLGGVMCRVDEKTLIYARFIDVVRLALYSVHKRAALATSTEFSVSVYATQPTVGALGLNEPPSLVYYDEIKPVTCLTRSRSIDSTGGDPPMESQFETQLSEISSCLGNLRTQRSLHDFTSSCLKIH